MGFVTTMKAGFSYLKSIMFKKPETSLENFYINRFGKVLYGMFLKDIPRSCGEDIQAKFQPTGVLSV